MEDYTTAKHVLTSDDWSGRYPCKPLYLELTMNRNLGNLYYLTNWELIGFIQPSYAYFQGFYSAEENRGRKREDLQSALSLNLVSEKLRIWK